MKKMAVVIPCYNEAKNIPLILERFAEVITRSDVELLLVDNGSSDSSPGVLEEQIPKFRFARTYRVAVNQGYGHGIVQGLAQTDAEFIGWTHADMQTDPADLLRALELIEQSGGGKDIYAKGFRRGRALAENVFTAGMSVLETILFGTVLWDINAQPNIFHRTFFEQWKDPPSDFSLDLFAFFQAKKHKLKIVRFDVRFPPRIHGESSWNTGINARIKFIKRTLAFSFQLKNRLKASTSTGAKTG